MNTLQTSSSTKHKRRLPPVFFAALLLLSLGAVFVLSLCFGSVKIDLFASLSALACGDVSSPDVKILLYLRLPRLCAGLLSGMALAVAGVLIQGVLHNPMAAPNIIGVNSGAGLGAVLVLTVFPSAVTFLPIAAFGGALLACLLIYALSFKVGADKLTVTLVGVALASVLNGGINTLKILFPDSAYDADAFFIGGLSGVTFSRLAPAAVMICLALVVTLVLAKDLDILALGDNTARTLGMNVRTKQCIILILAAILAGAAVSFAGLLGFVGLVVPHIARRFAGQNHRLLLPVSALMGGLLVTVCDLLSRLLFAPYEVPVGILLSFVGGPFFLFLLLRRKGRRP